MIVRCRNWRIPSITFRLSGFSETIASDLFENFIRRAHDFKIIRSSFGHRNNCDIMVSLKHKYTESLPKMSFGC